MSRSKPGGGTDVGSAEQAYRWTKIGGLLTLASFGFSLFEAFGGPQWVIGAVSRSGDAWGTTVAGLLSMLGTVALFLALGISTMMIVFVVPMLFDHRLDRYGMIQAGLCLLAGCLVAQVLALVLVPMAVVTLVLCILITLASTVAAAGTLVVHLIVAKLSPGSRAAFIGVLIACGGTRFIHLVDGGNVDPESARERLCGPDQVG